VGVLRAGKRDNPGSASAPASRSASAGSSASRSASASAGSSASRSASPSPSASRSSGSRKPSSSSGSGSSPGALTCSIETYAEGGKQDHGAGIQAGPAANLKFYVIIKATTVVREGRQPSEIDFKLTRKGVVAMKTGYLITDPKDPDGPKPAGSGKKKYTYRTHGPRANEGVTDWIVTMEKGKWKIEVANHRSTPVFL